MPVRSFYIRDLLEDGGGGGGEQNGGLVVDDVVVVIESPVRASADAGKELVVSEGRFLRLLSSSIDSISFHSVSSSLD